MTQANAIECVAFRPGWESELARFFDALDAAGDRAFFHPHRGDEATLSTLSRNIGADLHYLLVQDRDVLAYGLLRGWDAGYAIPSLGIAVHPSSRAGGLGRLMMDYLEAMARHRGASAVRLRVHKDNSRARDLYVLRGYQMTTDDDDERLMVGLKTLGSGVA